jgi:hypothetical protein
MIASVANSGDKSESLNPFKLVEAGDYNSLRLAVFSCAKKLIPITRGLSFSATRDAPDPMIERATLPRMPGRCEPRQSPLTVAHDINCQLAPDAERTSSIIDTMHAASRIWIDRSARVHLLPTVPQTTQTTDRLFG